MTLCTALAAWSEPCVADPSPEVVSPSSGETNATPSASNQTSNSAAANPSAAVLVLEAPSVLGWKPGVQALVAELLTTGHELSVRGAGATAVEHLEPELALAVAASGAAAGVSVVLQGSEAVAILCLRGASACEHLQVPVMEGELSRSRLALLVVERLRPLELPIPVRPEPQLPPPQVKPPVAPKTKAVAQTRAAVPVWVGGGVALSAGTAVRVPWLSLALGHAFAEPWGGEVTLSGSPFSGVAETSAGSLSVRSLQALAFATFDPFTRRSYGFSLGLGGGALRLAETASPAAGYDGFSATTTVGVVSARARVFRRIGPLLLGLACDPGMLVPAVSVKSGTETVLKIGRPWLTLQASLGLSL